MPGRQELLPQCAEAGGTTVIKKTHWQLPQSKLIRWAGTELPSSSAVRMALDKQKSEARAVREQETQA